MTPNRSKNFYHYASKTVISPSIEAFRHIPISGLSEKQLDSLLTEYGTGCVAVVSGHFSVTFKVPPIDHCTLYEFGAAFADPCRWPSTGTQIFVDQWNSLYAMEVLV
ncbi:MAG: hypothetical protein ACKOFU_00945, partial [Actinomycetota bacterium]